MKIETGDGQVHEVHDAALAMVGSFACVFAALVLCAIKDEWVIFGVLSASLAIPFAIGFRQGISRARRRS